eukprot:7297-Prorocentrum_minimum.AAC.8
MLLDRSPPEPNIPTIPALQFVAYVGVPRTISEEKIGFVGTAPLSCIADVSFYTRWGTHAARCSSRRLCGSSARCACCEEARPLRERNPFHRIKVRICLRIPLRPAASASFRSHVYCVRIYPAGHIVRTPGSCTRGTSTE